MPASAQERGRRSGGPERGLRPGAPDRGVRLEGLRGEAFREAELEQGSTILVVWASWSPKCRDIVDRVNALQSRWSSSARVVTVNFQEDPEDARRFLEGKRLEAPVFMDRVGAFAKKHSVATLPSLLLFRDGRELYRGALPADVDRLIASTFENAR
ncbi:MAG: TlpA family protein disulfide reductase [Acidobacteria bacterium]|nr:TlpA family protein disulfide reductase [Acidobacteriota bacterium]